MACTEEYRLGTAEGYVLLRTAGEKTRKVHRDHIQSEN